MFADRRTALPGGHAAHQQRRFKDRRSLVVLGSIAGGLILGLALVLAVFGGALPAHENPVPRRPSDTGSRRNRGRQAVLDSCRPWARMGGVCKSEHMEVQDEPGETFLALHGRSPGGLETELERDPRSRSSLDSSFSVVYE